MSASDYGSPSDYGILIPIAIIALASWFFRRPKDALTCRKCDGFGTGGALGICPECDGHGWVHQGYYGPLG